MDKLIKIKNVGRKVSRLGLLSWLLLALPASAAPLLYEVRFNPLLNGETEIEFVFDEPLLQEPDISLLNEPSRLNVRFAEAELEQRIADVAINNAGVSRVKSTLSEGGINSVISMDSLKVYRTRLDGNVYAVHLANSPQIVKAGSTSELNPSFINKLQAIDFRRGDKGEGRILVFLKENAAAVDVQERLGKLEIEFYNTDIPDELLYQLDVGDFATVVKGIETFKTKTSTRLVIDATDQFTFNYQQIDNIFTVTMQRDLTSRSILGGGRDYKGRAISLNFQDIPVRTVLQIIADYNGFNLVTSDS
ncbi:MAG: type IV pilus secretin PilQ, partial [Alishewanella sp.]|nr:type IV pilus secretin PilQ [Alishewanella sp.]